MIGRIVGKYNVYIAPSNSEEYYLLKIVLFDKDENEVKQNYLYITTKELNLTRIERELRKEDVLHMLFLKPKYTKVKIEERICFTFLG